MNDSMRITPTPDPDAVTAIALAAWAAAQQDEFLAGWLIGLSEAVTDSDRAVAVLHECARRLYPTAPTAVGS